MKKLLANKIKKLTKERDIAKEALPLSYHFQIEKDYRHSVIELFKENK